MLKRESLGTRLEVRWFSLPKNFSKSFINVWAEKIKKNPNYKDIAILNVNKYVES